VSAAGDVVAVDSKVLANAKVDRNGKQVGSVQRMMEIRCDAVRT
jgi:hypothetical protein